MQPLLQWKSKKCYIFCECAARNAHGLYCHLWPAGLYNILPYPIFGTIKKKVIEHEVCVLIFSKTFF